MTSEIICDFSPVLGSLINLRMTLANSGGVFKEAGGMHWALLPPAWRENILRSLFKQRAIYSVDSQKKCCHQMSDFKAEKMHQIRFGWGLHTTHLHGELTALPRSPI